MKKRGRLLKRLTSMLLTACVLLSVLPVTALADWSAWSWTIKIKVTNQRAAYDRISSDKIIPDFEISCHTMYTDGLHDRTFSTGRIDNMRPPYNDYGSPISFKTAPSTTAGIYSYSIMPIYWNGQHIGNLDGQGGTVLLVTFQGLYVDRVGGDTMNLDYHTGGLTHTSDQRASLWCATINYHDLSGNVFRTDYAPAKWVDADGEDSAGDYGWNRPEGIRLDALGGRFGRAIPV